MTKPRTIIKDAEYPVFDASGQPSDWFLDGIAEWEKKGCPEDGLGVVIGKHMRKAVRHGTLPPLNYHDEGSGYEEESDPA